MPLKAVNEQEVVGLPYHGQRLNTLQNPNEIVTGSSLDGSTPQFLDKIGARICPYLD